MDKIGSVNPFANIFFNEKRYRRDKIRNKKI